MEQSLYLSIVAILRRFVLSKAIAHKKSPLEAIPAYPTARLNAVDDEIGAFNFVVLRLLFVIYGKTPFSSHN